VKRVSLFPYRDDEEVLELIRKDNRPRKTARAILLVEAENSEQALDLSTDFVHTVCDLQGLAQKNSVTFWGAAVYDRNEGSWKVQQKSWNAIRTEPPWSFFGHSVSTTELQGHFRKWLAAIDEPEFPLNDFVNSVHLLIDSCRPDQFLEVMFLEDWVAFELLVNQLAERTEIDEGAANLVLREMIKGVGKYVEKNFRDKLGGEAHTYVREQLSALRRIPVSHLIERYARRHGIELKNYDIETLKKIRNGLMHSGKEPGDYPLDFNSMTKMRGLLEESLLSMIWTKQVNRTERPSQDPRTDRDTPPLEENLAEYSLSFDAQIRDDKGQSVTKGKFDVKWTWEEINVSGKTEDPMPLWVETGDQSKGYVLSGPGSGGVVTVSYAQPTRLGRFDVEMRALRVAIDYPR